MMRSLQRIGNCVVVVVVSLLLLCSSVQSLTLMDQITTNTHPARINMSESSSPSSSSVPPPPTTPPSRRSFLSFTASATAVFGLGLGFASSVSPAHATLDMEAFAQSQLSSSTGNCDEALDKKCQPKLSEDAALCRFGQPSRATGEACLRAKLPTTRKGGVDAFGNTDRGDYKRCKVNWIDDGKSRTYLKEWDCQ